MDARVPPVERQPDAEGQPHLPEDLHDRIGQMVLVGFRGMTPHEAESTLRHIRAGSIGGVVLYDVGGRRVAELADAGRFPNRTKCRA